MKRAPAYDDALSAGNKPWACAAPVKIVVIGTPEEQPDRNGLHAWLLDVRASAREHADPGLRDGPHHPRDGGLRRAEDRARLLHSAAVSRRRGGRGGLAREGRILPEDVRAKDLKPRVSKAAGEIAFADTFGGKL